MAITREQEPCDLGVSVWYTDHASGEIAKVTKFRGSRLRWLSARIVYSDGDLGRLAELEAKSLDHCYPAGSTRPYAG